MTPQELKNSILQLAVHGRLVPQKDTDVKVELSEYKVKKTEEIEFDLPDNWVIGHLECVTDSIPSKQYQILESQVLKEGRYAVVSQSKEYSIGYSNDETKLFHHSKPVIVFGDHTTEVKMVDFDFVVGADGVKIFLPKECLFPKFFYYVMLYLCTGLNKIGGYSRHYKYIKNKPIPIPPLTEQERIVERIEDLIPLLDRYEQAWYKLEAFNKRFPLDMQKSILQLAIQGKLVPQDLSEGTAKELLACANIKDNVDGQRVKQKIITDITDEDKSFDIPGSWEWIKLGSVCTIARGGSPRPIKEYITDSDDGVNWIKIGDTEKNGKYIYSTAEKIKPSGVSKSRKVHAGDFLLTNSMSFGRPYILKTDGCIHDGWLVISQSTEVFDQDYLYWMLSSGYAYTQFCGKVSGAVVKNLNSDKVANSVFPLPPLAEQKRIVNKLEELLPLCEKLKGLNTE